MKIRILLATLLFPTALAAQPVLTAAIHQPQHGDAPIRQALSPDTLFPGPSGSNVTWNFSALQLQAFPDSLQAVAVIALPPWYCDIALEATNSPSPKVDYYIAAGDSLAYAGRDYSNADFDPAQFWDSELMLRFPTAYGDHLVDDFTGTHQSIAGPASFNGRTHVQADAFGTLVLPGGTYLDVLRIRQHDTLVVFGTYLAFDTYYFYSANLRYPLLVIAQNTYWRGSYVETYYPQAIVTGQPEPQAVLKPQLWPNPFHDQLHFKTTAPGTLRIIGMDGREYFSADYRDKAAMQTLTLDGLPAGTYLAAYTDRHGGWRQLIVRH